MKKLLLLSVLFAFLPAWGGAHAPQKVEVSYDKKTSIVKIVVTHSVRDVKTHYVESLTLKVDGKEVKTLTKQQQDTKNTETFEVFIKDLKPGSQIEAVAACNLMGSKKGKLKVE